MPAGGERSGLTAHFLFAANSLFWTIFRRRLWGWGFGRSVGEIFNGINEIQGIIPEKLPP
jgi:hypothetical protein